MTLRGDGLNLMENCHAENVLTGQLDGSTSFVSLSELTDMRRWVPKATHSEWTPTDVIP